MLTWLKNKLRNWILEDDEPDFDLDCIISDGGSLVTITYRIIGDNGICLVGVPMNQQGGCRIIRIQEAKNKKQFTKLWMHYCGGRRYTWDDGEPYVPS